MNSYIFTDRVRLDQQLTDDVAQQLRQALAERGEALLVVSGGSTPAGFFERLSRCDLQWDRVTVTLADERRVSPDHPDSNEKLVREKLLVNRAAAARFVSLVTTDQDATQGQAVVEQRLAALGKFDVVVLGMGGDGHTASLFPQAHNLKDGLDPDGGNSCIVIDPVTAPHQRLSLTLPRLLRARQVIIHITGNEKRAVLERATRDGLPISAVLNQSCAPVTLYWAP